MSDFVKNKIDSILFKKSNKFIDNDKFFKHVLPLSYYIRVQFRIPPSLIDSGKISFKNLDIKKTLNQITGTNKGYTFFDDFYQTEFDYLVEEDSENSDLNSKTNTDKIYWVDITVSANGHYSNSCVISNEIEDNMGFRKFKLGLFDRNFTNIEKLLFFAQQVIFYGKNEEKKGGKTLSINNKRKGFDTAFILNKKLSNIRIKIGYANNSISNGDTLEETINTFKDLINNNNNIDDIYKSWGDFSNRTADTTIKESPWIEGIITGCNRSIADEGGTYSIDVVDENSLLFNNIEVFREFAILKASTFNILNIVNDVADTILNLKSHKDFNGNDLFKNQILNDSDFNDLLIDGNVGESVTLKIKDFFENYYNPAYAFDTDIGGEIPRKNWRIFKGSTEPFEANIEYQMLESPPSSSIIKPRETLGSILNEILLKIPPKRFLISNEGEIEEITDDDEKYLIETNFDINSLISKKGLKTISDWKIDETMNKTYKYKIEEFKLKESKKIGMYTLKKEKRLIFYYGDWKKTNKQDQYRIYTLRHPNTIAKSFSFFEDNMYVLFNYNIRMLNKKSEIKTIRDKISDSVYNVNEKILKEKENKLNDSELSDLQNLVEKKVINEYLNANIGTEEDTYKKIYRNNMFLGQTTLDDGNENLFLTLANILRYKITLEIFGDPYWFFDKHINAGETCIRIDVYRTNTGGLSKDVLLSGYYLLLNIKHRIMGEYVTILELQKFESQDSFEKKISADLKS